MRAWDRPGGTSNNAIGRLRAFAELEHALLQAGDRRQPGLRARVYDRPRPRARRRPTGAASRRDVQAGGELGASAARHPLFDDLPAGPLLRHVEIVYDQLGDRIDERQRVDAGAGMLVGRRPEAVEYCGGDDRLPVVAPAGKGSADAAQLLDARVDRDYSRLPPSGCGRTSVQTIRKHARQASPMIGPHRQILERFGGAPPPRPRDFLMPNQSGPLPAGQCAPPPP